MDRPRDFVDFNVLCYFIFQIKLSFVIVLSVAVAVCQLMFVEHASWLLNPFNVVKS
jgi:hypothetical protein